MDFLVSESNSNLYGQMIELDPALPRVLEDVASEILSYDPNLPACWSEEGITAKVSTHLLRYVVPYYELLRFSGRKQYSKLLVAELLSCCVWRTFDNCVDQHEPLKEAHLRSLLALARLVDFVHCHWPVPVARGVQQHCRVMSEQALRESIEPIALADIWKKCSILFYPPESLEKLDDGCVVFFKNYINYCGLSHDLSDFISDIAGQVTSLPVMWFREASENGVLSVSVLESMYRDARSAAHPIEATLSGFTRGGQLPLTEFLIAEAGAVLRG